LTAYDPTWPVRFAEQQTRLAALLKPWLAREIEHVGSTSVPGLRSKPIVDILAPVVSLAASRAAIPVLEKDGWLFWLDDPNENYRLWFLRPSPSARTHHLQVIQHDHPVASIERGVVYSPDLARKHQSDRNAYSNAKTEFVLKEE
jgi:GrpB-like predicted nucleotidyltransferase (UPF0157 family)